jgi:mono/diheme cytochrome c family protein/DNA-binding beta-propeller fold protein YncE
MSKINPVSGLLVSILAAASSLACISAYAEVVQKTGNESYQQHCASCHGANRAGLMGPALLPENLARLRKPAALDVVNNGRVATQMPAFKDVLSADELQQVVEYIYSTPEIMPSWNDDMIRASRKTLTTEKLSSEPIFDADLENVFVVVESGDHHVTILDGDKFEVITRFKSHFALHGGPKFTRDGHFVYFASRDGWVSKYDLYNLRYVSEVRVGINTRNIAVSDGGEYVIAANYWPHSLVVLDGQDLSLIKTIDAVSLEGESSRVSAVYHARSRQSFVAALKDVPELWEIPYDLTQPSPPTAPKRIVMNAILDDFFFSPDYEKVMGATRPLDSGTSGNIGTGQVIDLTLGRKVADLDLPGMPHLGSGISWQYQDRMIMASPNLRDAEVSIIDLENWETIKRIETKGPGFFMRSHEKTPYAWVDVFFGPHKDKIHIIDKSTLEIVRTLQPEPGKTVAHVEFTKDGRYALVSVIETDGALIVYDAQTFEEVTRLPMSRPVGKYNVYNKTHLSTGTSH